VTSTAALEHVQGRIRITAEAARERGLPAIAFTIDERDTGFSSTRFPEPEVYLTMSGPPGGPLLVMIRAWREASTDEGVIVRVLRERYSGPGWEPLAFGLPERTDLAGASRIMLPFTSGESLGRTIWCAIVVQPAPDASAGLLVTVGVGGRGAPDCRVPLGDEWIAKVLRTLRLE
jgi:hypothetical protein